ncbi:ALA-interacting subunit 1 [Zea mays]|uniref:ALA-interacting subunit 1 n=1 Tax=Zea mays TaxID=4577 RepID=A0A1D6MA97_MAIZE|nr:ALA-interacting subunit 1 [Zea mays]
MSSESDSLASRRSKKPKYSKFTQQELPACKPMLTPGIVIGAFSLIGVFFVPIGLASLSASHNIVEVIDRYDAECVSANDKVGFIQDTKTDKACTRKITVPKPMKGPIHIYYQLENFYQNHRRYVKSRNDMQLRNKGDASTIANCEPEATSEDGGKPIVPCGLIAWSLFNDTYSFSLNSKAVQVNKKNIAWDSDKIKKFGSDQGAGAVHHVVDRRQEQLHRRRLRRHRRRLPLPRPGLRHPLRHQAKGAWRPIVLVMEQREPRPSQLREG